MLQKVHRSRRVGEGYFLFQRRFAGGGKVTVRASARENERFFNGKDMAIFFACAKRVSDRRNLKYWKDRKE